MKQQRLDGLADGIFAIVMTLLAYELKAPVVAGVLSDRTLWDALLLQIPVLVSFILSFTLLFTYWRAHHFLAILPASTNVIHRLLDRMFVDDGEYI
jgi:uncharacterized membrane protein